MKTTWTISLEGARTTQTTTGSLTTAQAAAEKWLRSDGEAIYVRRNGFEVTATFEGPITLTATLTPAA